jgi:hypothetical protein
LIFDILIPHRQTLTGTLIVRLMTRPQSSRITAPWPAALGLAVILVLSATAWWRLRAEPGATDGAAAPAPASGTGGPLRFTVAADGSISVEGESTTIGLDGVADRLSVLSTARPVELIIDPGTSGAAVDGLLGRLRDAGVSRCTLIVDRTKATVDTRATPRPGGPEERKEAGP